ncbi:PREDICTED: DNA repair protein SWI5 homolog isoform X2 [Condylura cristata]|uniref:DNA repair protein SWI5 homolog isoform X2 n=1 Tax=Condylura cristata TaxID=143302 RepID=UPI0006433456|nr:PREDICTED: DNA repair protein SWI5 homolog isoform X2 [Condylura cristata]
MQSRSALFLLGPPPAPPHPHSTGSRPGRSPGPLSLAPLGSLCRTPPGRASSCRGAFRSPRPCPRSGQADGANDGSLPFDIQKLKEKRDTLDKEIAQLVSEGYSVAELDDHISQLHEYNDIKDVGQALLGKLAVIRGVATKELYPEFDLDVDD